MFLGGQQDKHTIMSGQSARDVRTRYHGVFEEQQDGTIAFFSDEEDDDHYDTIASTLSEQFQASAKYVLTEVSAFFKRSEVLKQYR